MMDSVSRRHHSQKPAKNTVIEMLVQTLFSTRPECVSTNFRNLIIMKVCYTGGLFLVNKITVYGRVST